MDNILLIFLNELENIGEFNEIIDKFSENNYSMYLLDNIKEDESFSMDLLESYVDFYKNQHEVVNKIVVLSNSRDLIFSWYRCFNSVVDDFIYFVDKDEKNYFQTTDRHFDFYYNLYEFNGIEDETVNGNVYLSDFCTMLLPMSHSLEYFDNLINYKYDEKTYKQKINKEYKFKDLEFNFISKEGWKAEKIKIGKINKRIVFIKGQSQYDTMRISTDYKVFFLRELGFEVDILDLLTDGLNIISDKLITRKPDFVFSSHCIGMDLKTNDGKNLYDVLNIPFYGGLGDHPIKVLDRIINSNKMAQFACLDEENIKYFNKYFPNKEIILEQRLGVLSKNYKEKEFKDREIDILFAASLINPSKIEELWENADYKTKNIIITIIDYIIQSGKVVDIDDEITRMYKEEMVINKNLKHRAYIHSCIEVYIRNYKRYELVKRLGQSGLEVLCIGNFEEYKKLNISGKLIFKDKVNYQELLDIYNNTKILINMTGHLYNGVTERILSAMINGAAVVTENDRFIHKNFNDKENIILYDLLTFNNTVESIKEYLNNHDSLKEIAENGQSLVRQKYNYKEGLLKTYRLMREFNLKHNSNS